MWEEIFPAAAAIPASRTSRDFRKMDRKSRKTGKTVAKGESQEKSENFEFEALGFTDAPKNKTARPANEVRPDKPMIGKTDCFCLR